MSADNLDFEHLESMSAKQLRTLLRPESWRKMMQKHYPKLNIGILERELLGPRLFVRQRDLVTHPEHAHVSLPGGSDCQVMYQLNPKTMRRAED